MITGEFHTINAQKVKNQSWFGVSKIDSGFIIHGWLLEPSSLELKIESGWLSMDSTWIKTKHISHTKIIEVIGNISIWSYHIMRLRNSNTPMPSLITYSDGNLTDTRHPMTINSITKSWHLSTQSQKSIGDPTKENQHSECELQTITVWTFFLKSSNSKYNSKCVSYDYYCRDLELLKVKS